MQKKKKQFTDAENQKYKETDSINSLQSSPKSHPMWVTLYLSEKRKTRIKSCSKVGSAKIFF